MDGETSGLGLRASESVGRTVAESRRRDFDRLTQGRLDRAYRLAAALLRDPVEAEDAVSEAAVLAWSHWDQLREVSRFDAWFDRILINECRARLRRRRRMTLRDLPVSDATPDIADAVLSRAALRAALASLSVDHQLVVVLRYLEDLPIAAIAERIHQRQGTVKSRLHFALQRLRIAYLANEKTDQ